MKFKKLFFIIITLWVLVLFHVPEADASTVVHAESWSNPYTLTFFGHYGGVLDGTISGTADGGYYEWGGGTDNYWFAKNRYIDIGRSINMNSSYNITFSGGGYVGYYYFYVSGDGSNWTYVGSFYGEGYEVSHPFTVNGGSINAPVRYIRANTSSSALDYFYFTIDQTDTTPPNLSISENTTSWTNQSITLTATATDAESGVQRIQTPDGNWVYSSTANYTVVNNGTYNFVAVDNAGNQITKSITVSNIDNLPNAPTITSYSNGQIINTNAPTISWNFSDPDNGDYQGWYEIVASNNNWQSYYYDSGVVQSGNKYATLPALPDGTWQFAVRTWDEKGMWTPPWGYLSNIRIDTTAPTGSYTLSPSTFSLNQTTITVTASDNVSGVRRIQLPDGNYVNGATATYTANQNANYTFVLEDNNGNRGNYTVPVTNVYHKPTITATPNASGNYVSLNWTAPDNWQNYSYMLYEKAPGKTEYQTIPAKSTIKVLNVYPTATYCNGGNDDLQPFTFTNWQGQTFTIPKSASLKAWMEQPNSEDPKGYGKGLISVDTVSIKDFDANPTAYLKNTDGSWKYDVVYEGMGDCNNSQDLSSSAETTLQSFINSGRGYLGGHDTFLNQPVREELASNLNMDVGTNTSFYGATTVEISKKGLLTSYPWNIGDVGTVLNVPLSHTSYQFAKGDVWLKYTTNQIASGAEVTNYNGQTGTDNFYLTTWNNTAMIQTGHSQAQASPDEEKVLANTLFYLAQITDKTSWDDHSGQDVTPPNMPTITGVTPNPSQSQVNVSYTPATDNGSTYSYYVEATGSNNSAKSDSDTVTTTITSGVKGYSIVVDNSPNTIPDNTIETTSTNYTITYPISGNFYVHVATVDNAGNVSQVATYHFIDNNPPSLTITPSETGFVNHSITLTANATDAETGVWRIQTPDGNWINDSQATFSVETDGTYTFVAEDKAGNLTTKSITVNNIDETPPSSPTISTNSFWTNASSVPVSITSGTDTQSGVTRTEYSLSGATTQDWTIYNGVFNITNEGITTITARSIDNVGNISSVSTNVVKIDRTSPINPSITIQLKS